MKRTPAFGFKPITFTFTQSPETFIVHELGTVKPKNRGKFLYLHIEKRELTTWQMLKIIAQHFEVSYHTIGYAGLKDKHALSRQYISLSNKALDRLHTFSHPNITILKHFVHDEPVKRGALKGNRFIITLHDVELYTYNVILKRFSTLMKHGMPNFFGFQRFGKGFDDLEQIQAIAHGDAFIKDKEKGKMIVASYQSHLFNNWLNARIAHANAQASPFDSKLLGDVVRVGHKLQNVTQLPFKNGVVTGLIAGKSAWRAKKEAAVIEAAYDDAFIDAQGERRDMVVFPNLESQQYDKQHQTLQLTFTLPKSSYATVLLEQIKADTL